MTRRRLHKYYSLTAADIGIGSNIAERYSWFQFEKHKNNNNNYNKFQNFLIIHETKVGMRMVVFGGGWGEGEIEKYMSRYGSYD